MPSYTYTTNIPIGNQTPAQQRPALNTNTNSIDSLLDVDLFGFNDNNGGFHQKSTYVVQGSDPVPDNTYGNQAILYSKTISAIAELFLTRNGSVTPIQMSSGTVVKTGGLGSFGQTFLPGGLQLKWGVVTVTPPNTTVTFTLVGLTAFPSSGIVAFATAYATGSQFSIANLTATTITVGSSGGGNAFWLAIGV